MNQDIKRDKGKYRPTIVPLKGIAQRVSPVREFGIDKYGSVDSWRKVEVERYRDAFFRHALAYMENKYSKDVESGLYHFQHMLCNACFLAELEVFNEVTHE